MHVRRGDVVRDFYFDQEREIDRRMGYCECLLHVPSAFEGFAQTISTLADSMTRQQRDSRSLGDVHVCVCSVEKQGKEHQKKHHIVKRTRVIDFAAAVLA